MLLLANVVTLGFYREKWTGTLPTVFLPPGSRYVHYFARGIVHYHNAFFTIAMGFLAGVLILDLDFSNANWGTLLASVFLIVTALIMFALFLGGLTLLLRDWQNLYMAVLGIIIGLTGVVVPVSSLPTAFEGIAQILPISHGLVALQDSIAGASLSEVKGNLIAEALVGLGYALAGYLGFIFAERELKRRGIMVQQGI